MVQEYAKENDIYLNQEKDGQVMIHLYDINEKQRHSVTYDWYTVDWETGRGENV